MDDYFSTSIARERVSATLMVGFAAFGLMLAALGVYGVMAVSVSQRTTEFGIRLALGARAKDIVSLAVTGSVTMIGIGVLVGTGFAIALNRVVAHLLTEIGRVDVPTLAGAAALIVAAAVLACVLPAVRAARIDPVSALKPGT
jgi:ABC-type antimicrobial peptide transport system permease subunit